MIPENKLRSDTKINLTSMIDFLFVMLCVFATLAVTRATLFDTNVKLATLSKDKASNAITPASLYQINISISDVGIYKWITDAQDYAMPSYKEIQQEILQEYQKGILPKDKTLTQIYLHIDRKASWEKIAELLFAIREIGFDAHPIYLPQEKK
jgi:biopolymer transport protein ExbD